MLGVSATPAISADSAPHARWTCSSRGQSAPTCSCPEPPRRASKLESPSLGLFAASLRPTAMDLTTAYRYNQNMMEYYTCK